MDKGQSGVITALSTRSTKYDVPYQGGKDNKKGVKCPTPLPKCTPAPCPFNPFTGTSTLGITIGVVMQKKKKPSVWHPQTEIFFANGSYAKLLLLIRAHLRGLGAQFSKKKCSLERVILERVTRDSSRLQ